MKAGLNIFFENFIETLQLREGAKKLVHQAQERYKTALISNFTHAPVIYKSLSKVSINKFFNTIVVSEEIGWRKPSSRIFKLALNRLQVEPTRQFTLATARLKTSKALKRQD